MLIRFLFFVFIFTAFWGLWRINSHKRNKQFVLQREIVLTLFFLYLLGVFFVTFEPFRFHMPDSHPLVAYLIPFNEISAQFGRNASIAWYYLIANIVMLVPLGMLLPFILRKESLVLVFIIGFVFSVTIEVIQLLFTVRSADIDDVIFNVTGAVIGFCLYKIIKKLR